MRQSAIATTYALTPDGGATTSLALVAGPDGRLELPPLALGPTRPLDERIELVEAGLFGFPHTRIRVRPSSGS